MEIPEKIGHYEIKSELGRGGMATVYRAYDPRFEREVAIKVLPHEMLHDPQFRTRFEREAKTIAILEHPAIVPVYDVGEENGQPYFVMRFMTGGSLTDRMKQGPLSIRDVARIIDRIAAALDEAHARGIVHRDLKPANILFDRAGEPYLSDFGIAKMVASQTNVTGSGIIGTPTYMSPEQAKGEAVDGRSDIYTLGVILYELLAGKPPYTADTPMGIAVKHITDPVPHILDVNPALPPVVEDLIERAMAKNREERFSTAGELSQALDEIVLGNMPELEKTRVKLTQTRLARQKASPTTKKVSKDTGRRFPWLVVILLAVVCLAAAGATGLFAFRGTLMAMLATGTPPPTAMVSPTEAVVVPTATSNLPPLVEATATLGPTDTPAPAALPVLGGADKIAFIASNNVWMMNVDGNELTKLTTDGAVKSNLQWLPDGNTLVYISGKCVGMVSVDTGRVDVLTCFDSAEYFDGFQISPDGKQVAISISRELFVVPFDVPTLQNTRSKPDLVAMEGCLTYTKVSTKDIRWSSDGKQIAVLILGVNRGRQEDIIRVLDIQRCNAAEPVKVNEFPGAFFTMSGYNDNPYIPDFSWDGSVLFLLNSLKRNDGYGDLYAYNLDTHKADPINPVNNNCCYRDARWSPDGHYIVFAYQDVLQGARSQTQIYYIPYGTIGTGAVYEPIELPDDFMIGLREKLQFALRRVK